MRESCWCARGRGVTVPGASVPVGKVQPTSDLDRQDTRRSHD